MRDAIKPFMWAAFAFLVIAGASLAVLAQQGAAAGARKKILFLTYPGVGAPGSHGHASLRQPLRNRRSSTASTAGSM